MAVNIQTIKDIRIYLSQELDSIYQEPELTALTNIIIKTILGVTKLHQVYLSEHTLTSTQIERCIEICTGLKSGNPIQYILGETVFYDCRIKVTKATLIPRPETEELVHYLLKQNDGYTGNIIDFGTGSGCIAIALARNLPGSEITGIDLSEEALAVAKQNAFLNDTNVSFLKRDILNFDYSLIPMAGIIVSNPPYVRDSEKKLMNKNVLDFEPHQALFVSDTDPLIFYRAILEIARKILLKGGSAWFEFNEALGNSMIDLLESFGYIDIKVIKDLNGRDRIIKGLKNE
jgi:release factor glutamine methyltransferase